MYFAEKKSHYYLRDGTPLFEVPNLSKPGQMRPANKTDARKLDAIPSVTTIMRVINKDGINIWEKQNLMLSALTLPDNDWVIRDGESHYDVARRIVVEAERLQDSAPNLGSAIHALLAQYSKHRERTNDPELMAIMAPAYDWFDENILEVIGCEERVIGDDYAGTYDLLAIVKGHGRVLVDWKSQKIKAKPVHYWDWCAQLSAYSKLLGAEQCMSIVIGTNTPMVDVKLWNSDDINLGLEYFNAAKIIWRIQNR